MRIQTARFESRVAAGDIVGEPATVERGLGDEYRAIRGEGGGIEAFVLVWRFRNVLSSCTVVGGLAADEPQAVEIARAQQARISAALA